MSEDDRQRWNRNYSTSGAGHDAPGSHGGGPASFLGVAQRYLPTVGRALDVAGGAGRNAVWLAQRGLHTTLIDVSDAGIAAAQARAERAGVALSTLRVDLENEALPVGPWDVIVCFQYLQRALFPEFAKQMGEGGRLVFSQPTVRNLQRHPKPSRRFLLAEGEAEALVTAAGFEILLIQENWSEAGRHEARVIAGM